MGKRAVSVTLDEANVLWIRGRVAAGASASVSELLDELVTEARVAGRGVEAGMRSVAGTIDISEADPQLLAADTVVRTQFEASLRRPMVKESVLSKGRRRRG